MMPLPRDILVAFLCLLTAGCSLAIAGSLDHELLDSEAFPVGLAAMKRGELLEVVAAEAGELEAVDRFGNGIDLSETKMLLAKGNSFADGEIQIITSRVATLHEGTGTGKLASKFSRRHADTTEIEAIISPSRDYDDVVMAAVFYTDFRRYEIIPQSIGSLRGGHQRVVTFQVPIAYDYINHQVNYTLLFFSDEGEIVSDARGQSTPLINNMFRDFYREIVDAYKLAANEPNRPVSLVHQYPVDLGYILKTADRKSGRAVFTLSVDALGMVKRVETSDPVDPAIFAGCERSLKEWLFLPRLQDGFAISSKVRVPVSW